MKRMGLVKGRRGIGLQAGVCRAGVDEKSPRRKEENHITL